MKRLPLLTTVLAVAVVATSAATSAAAPAPPVVPVAAVDVPRPGVPNPDILVGANSRDWNWLDQAVGPLDVYRYFDRGFSFATWQQTDAARRHPNAPMYDYSTKLLPQRLLNPADPVNAQYRAFLATTPKNIVITNFHEPDNKTTEMFTPAQFRASILKLKAMVDAQNTADGGNRLTVVTLMDVTFGNYGRSRAIDWWPTRARDGGTVDMIQIDAYALPHLTATPGIPAGYTSGEKWLRAPGVLGNILAFAKAQDTPWAVAELGYLENVNNANQRSQTITEVVAYAEANGAHHISYFDNVGPRADWRLRHSTPVGTTSMSSPAARTWRSIMATHAG